MVQRIKESKSEDLIPLASVPFMSVSKPPTLPVQTVYIYTELKPQAEWVLFITLLHIKPKQTVFVNEAFTNYKLNAVCQCLSFELQPAARMHRFLWRLCGSAPSLHPVWESFPAVNTNHFIKMSLKTIKTFSFHNRAITSHSKRLQIKNTTIITQKEDFVNHVLL